MPEPSATPATPEFPATPKFGSPALHAHDSPAATPCSQSPLVASSQRAAQVRNRWLPWHDRLLAIQVLAEGPIDCPSGETTKRWNKVASTLAEVEGLGERTGESCKQHVKRLLKMLKVCAPVHSLFLALSLSYTCTPSNRAIAKHPL